MCSCTSVLISANVCGCHESLCHYYDNRLLATTICACITFNVPHSVCGWLHVVWTDCINVTVLNVRTPSLTRLTVNHLSHLYSVVHLLEHTSIVSVCGSTSHPLPSYMRVLFRGGKCVCARSEGNRLCV